MKKIVIVDYGLGNLASVKRALDYLNVHSEISFDKSTIEKAEGLILPGVGSFGSAINNIEKLNLLVPLKEYVASGKPILGICLGMQLFMDESEESPGIKGLSLLPGKVLKFKSDNNRYKVPHIGWSVVNFPENHFLCSDVGQSEAMYFVHSYYVNVVSGDVNCGYTEYAGHKFCSFISHENIYGFQGHPEKSGPIGLKILKKFTKICFN